MVVRVHLHTILQRETPQGLVRYLEVELPAGGSLADLLSYLEITLQPDALLLVVNGRTAELEHQLQENDEVHLIPAMSGGGFGYE